MPTINLDGHVATLVAVLLVLAGCVIAIVHPETLSFSQLLDDAKYLIGLLAVGRGLAAARSTTTRH